MGERVGVREAVGGRRRFRGGGDGSEVVGDAFGVVGDEWEGFEMVGGGKE